MFQFIPSNTMIGFYISLVKCSVSFQFSSKTCTPIDAHELKIQGEGLGGCSQ